MACCGRVLGDEKAASQSASGITMEGVTTKFCSAGWVPGNPEKAPPPACRITKIESRNSIHDADSPGCMAWYFWAHLVRLTAGYPPPPPSFLPSRTCKKRFKIPCANEVVKKDICVVKEPKLKLEVKAKDCVFSFYTRPLQIEPIACIMGPEILH